MRTRGEEVFAAYLAANDIPFKYEPDHVGKRKKPDFVVNWDGALCLFDTKDRENADAFDSLAAGVAIDDKLRVSGGAAISPSQWIRRKIEKGRVKFREFKGNPCALVLFPASGWASDLSEPDFVLAAMYGDVKIVVPYNLGRPFDSRTGFPSIHTGSDRLARK
jgi:hypothetical protein